MKIPRSVFAIAACFLAATPFAGAPSARASDPPKPVQWSRTMQELYKTLAELMTDVSSDKRFAAPGNQARIERNAKKLAALAHDVKKGKAAGSPDADPSIALLGTLFSDDADRAYQAFKWGHKPYARELLRGMTGYCIACHTRTQSGPSFSELPLNPADGALKTTERGDFFAATRQYDKALAEFNTVIDAAPAAGARPLEWTGAVRNALAIAVRVKRDPELALDIVNRAIASKSIPFFFKEDAQAWKASIEEWRKEPQHQALGDEGLHAETVRLLANARQAQKYPADRSADVLYLRASASVHDLLRRNGESKHAAEGFLMAGLCYDVLRPFRLGELHELYYEGCVRKSPHTPLAESCFKRLQQSVYEGFTGSSGTDVPEDVQRRLAALQSLATQQIGTHGAKPQ